MGTLDRYPESVRQVAVAEHLFLTKTDLPGGAPAAALLARLHGINAGATLHTQHQGQSMALHQLVQAAPERGAAAEPPFFYQAWAAPLPEAAAQHRDGISSFVLTRDTPLPREAFLAWLDMVIAMRGEDLLRVKGIVQLAEQPDQPLVIHGVQHLFQPPEYLPCWPGPDRRTRIVFITRGVDAQALDQTLDVLVRRHSRRSRASPPSPTR
jgi:G3E family GTPase